MGLLRVLLAIVFPPAAVIGKGCGAFLIVSFLTMVGYLPGILAALIVLANEE